MLGMHGNLGPNINTNKCDVLIAVGMRFDDRVTGNLATYAKQAKVIHFDIDPAEVNKNVHADIAVLGDCKETLVAVTELLQANRHTEWLESFTDYERMEEEKVIRPELHPMSDTLTMGEVVRAVSEATHNEAILVTDVGQNQMMSARYLNIAKSAVSSLPVVWERWGSDCLPLSVRLSGVPIALSVFLWVMADFR